MWIRSLFEWALEEMQFLALMPWLRSPDLEAAVRPRQYW